MQEAVLPPSGVWRERRGMVSRLCIERAAASNNHPESPEKNLFRVSLRAFWVYWMTSYDAVTIILFYASLLLVRDDELVSFAVDIDNLYLGIVFQMLAQLCDIDIHRAGVEVVIVYPDSLQGEVTLEDLVGVAA